MRRIRKVRFGGQAERLLHDMPSNADLERPPVRGPRLPRLRRRMRRILVVTVLLVAAFPLLLFGLVKSGLISPLIEDVAVSTLDEALPDGFAADIGDTTFITRNFSGVGVTLDKFAVRDTRNGRDVVQVDRTTFGVDTSTLLRGSPQVDSIKLSGVRVSLPTARGESGAATPTIAAIEPGLAQLLDATNILFDRTQMNGARVDIGISDMVVEAPGGDIMVTNAAVVARAGQRTIEADIEIDGQTSKLTGLLRRGRSGALSAQFKLDRVAIPAGRMRTLFSAAAEDHEPGAAAEPLLFNLSVDARRARVGSPDQLTLAVEPVDYALKLDSGDFVAVTGKLNFAWKSATKVLSLTASRLRVGRSSAVLTGGIRDSTVSTDAPGSVFDFELIANNGVSNPSDSPEQGVKFASRARGTWSSATGMVDFSRIEIDSDAGYAEGAGTLDLYAATPIAIFAISIENFALAGVKQLWPAPVARSARRWVLSSLAGGQVVKGDFLIAEPLRRRIPGSDTMLEGDTQLTLEVEGVRFDVTGDIPPVREAKGTVTVRDGATIISLDSGTVYMPSGRSADAAKGTLTIHPAAEGETVLADLDVSVTGTADALGELISYRPISAQQFRSYKPEDLSGQVEARVTMQFALNPDDNTPPPEWNVILDVKDAAILTPFEGRMLSDLSGRIVIDRMQADINVTGKIDGVPANIAMVQPFGGEAMVSSRDIVLRLTDADRKRMAPGLETLVSGITPVTVKTGADTGAMSVEADLAGAKLSLPWIGWAKGQGIAARTVFDLVQSDGETRISNFELDGGSFFAKGDIEVSEDGIRHARFEKVRLNSTDDASITVDAKDGGYKIDLVGKAFDARALIRHVREQLKAEDHEKGAPVELTATLAKVTGFGDETLRNVKVFLRYDGSDVVEVTASGSTASGFPFTAELKGAAAKRAIRAESLDAGELLRFLDIYGQVRGGIINVSLKAMDENVLTGDATMTDFRIFNEPRLNALVSSKSSGSSSLKEAIKREIDTREVVFDRASATLTISPYTLQIKDGAIRGPLVGSTFQGTLYDKNDRMRITGTFMPAYAANSLLTGIPIVGLVLGNGRDRGLIGVTYLLEGDSKRPKITVNPLSAIAPGVFRQIFEFR